MLTTASNWQVTAFTGPPGSNTSSRCITFCSSVVLLTYPVIVLGHFILLTPGLNPAALRRHCRTVRRRPRRRRLGMDRRPRLGKDRRRRFGKDRRRRFGMDRRRRQRHGRRRALCRRRRQKAVRRGSARHHRCSRMQAQEAALLRLWENPFHLRLHRQDPSTPLVAA